MMFLHVATDASELRPRVGWSMGHPVELIGLAALFVVVTLGLQLWPGVSEQLPFSWALSAPEPSGAPGAIP